MEGSLSREECGRVATLISRQTTLSETGGILKDPHLLEGYPAGSNFNQCLVGSGRNHGTGRVADELGIGDRLQRDFAVIFLGRDEIDVAIKGELSLLPEPA